MKQVAVLVLLLALVSRAVPAIAHGDDERAAQLAKEREKLEREKDPVARTKIDIRISEILLAVVGDSIQTENFGRMEENLNEYSAVIQDAHMSLVGSGRDAQKRSGGFKELEIALRKHVQRFDDLARALTLDRRPSLQKVKVLASGIRDRLLKALFP